MNHHKAASAWDTDNITRFQQQVVLHLGCAAQRYLALHPELAEEPMRFDLVHFAGEHGGWRRDVLQFDGR